ncbi:MAG: DNA polymerase I [Bacteroidales bacterium]|nr:DNA polymerase I [Bacteroidales bacterium]
MEQKKLFLLDAYALIFRAYYAFIRAQMINSKGLNTSAIYGFTATLEEILRTESPSHIAVVFDPPGPNFRHIKFPEYKANREATPEEIKQSVPWIKKIIEAFNIPVIEVQGYEADDVIGTMAWIAKDKGFQVYMMTPDKDFAQLVSDKVYMYKPRRSGNDSEILGVKEIREVFQVQDPRQVIDVLALWGDSSDNIPGAPGIGEKTAKKLIATYQTVENLFEHTNDLKGKVQESILQNKKQIELSKDLVTIRLDVPVEFDEDQLLYEGASKDDLVKLFKELEFKTLVSRVISGVSQEKPANVEQRSLFQDEGSETGAEARQFKTLKDIDFKYKCADSPALISALVEQLKKQAAFCFDTETTSINAIDAELVGMAFTWSTNQGWYVPLPEKREDAVTLVEQFRQVLENENSLKIGQNIKYDMQVMRNYGIMIRENVFDTMIAHYLLQPEQKHNLDYMAEVYLGYQTIHTEELIGKKGSQQRNMRDVPIERLIDYACEDTDITWQLYNILKDELRKNGFTDLAEKIEFPLISVLCAMEEAGISLDEKALKNFARELETDLIGLRDSIYELSGVEFNISSPKQLGEILFDKLKISSDAKKTKTKQYSTGEEVLVRLTDKHPVVGKVLEFRSLKKLLSTYVEALPKMINPRTGFIHTSYNQAVTATGRLSSNNPNLQNIPIREEKGREIRKSFIPRSDENVLLSADYSQIELRLMAHMSQDPLMIDAFQNGEDIHTATASKIFEVPPEQVTKEQRGKAKTANFGIIYGISAFGLAQRMNIPRTDAKQLIDNYFNTYARVREYMDEMIQTAREKGYVETMLGRRRYLRDILSRNAVVRGFAERNAINAPIQGSAADIIKIAMIRIQEILLKNNYRAKMILQVHDELVFDVFNKELDEVKQMVIREMEKAYSLSVPLLVEFGIGDNWLEAH